MRTGRGRLFTAALLLTASCGTFLSLGDDAEDNPPSPAPVPDGSGVADSERAEGSVVVDVPDTGNADGARDAGPKDVVAEDSAAVDAGPPPVSDAGALVFVTSGSYMGKVNMVLGPIGVAGADKICQDDAQARKLSGRFRAWLAADVGADASTLPPDTIKAFDGVPYVRPDGVRVVANFTAFAGGQKALDNPIALTLTSREDLSNRSPPVEVWSGLNHVGGHAVDCLQWTSQDPGQKGTFGIIEKCTVMPPVSGNNCDARWTSIDAGSCTIARRFYCVQSNEPAP